MKYIPHPYQDHATEHILQNPFSALFLEMGLGKLVVDPVSLDIIDDAVIDYKNNLSGSYFTVDIPSAISTCGCGTSFSI